MLPDELLDGLKARFAKSRGGRVSLGADEIAEWPDGIFDELLKAKLSAAVSAPVLISSVVRNQQILHRVRLGPLSSQSEAERLRDDLSLANFGLATLVRGD